MSYKKTTSFVAAGAALVTALYCGNAAAGNHLNTACDPSADNASFCEAIGHAIDSDENAIAVPEPNSIALLGATLMALGARGLLSSKRKSSADTKLSPPNIKNNELPNL